MRKPAKTAAVLFGLGVGVMVGPSLGSAALWSGITVAALGLALNLVGTAHNVDEPDDHDEDVGVAGDGAAVGSADSARRRRSRHRSGLAGLGTRVEQILRLAEEQADDHRTEAKREADKILTAARREAEAILDRAHEQAAGTTPAD
ncbi:DivIVA domain-containing protein [Micromonospora sp. NBC_01813]|uniref:DivIVA domain-containing protein n=1 Tax=Micromonospora sp. NBC_01813 TaxID=2975988 RepID=UPI003FA37FE4